MFEVYLQCFESGEPAGIPRAAVRSLLPVVAERGPNDWRVQYGEFAWCEVAVQTLDHDSELIDWLCVERPCGMGLWEDLFAIMRLGNVVFWSADSDPLIASDLAAEHMPLDMIEVLGQPKVIRSSAEIVEASGFVST